MRCPWAFVLCVGTVLAAASEDLYAILGVRRTASAKEIKSAYRAKARDTHPDKNRGLAPEAAAEAFRKVVHAFEVLSDKGSRAAYDRTGRSGSAQANRGRGFSDSFNFKWSSRPRRPQMKDRFDVKEARSRVMHIVSLTQLETVMLDDDGFVERSLMLVFVTAGAVDTVADDVLLFPYPFAGMSEQGIWWEDMLQTVKVRYHKGNNLTRFFDAPDGDDMRRDGRPMVAFVPRGAPLDAFTSTYLANHRDFSKWGWGMLEVDVEWVNAHSETVELYWIHGSSGKLRANIPPGHSYRSRTMLSHEWYVRDARVDRHTGMRRNRLATNSSLGSWKIMTDTQDRIVIRSRPCTDLSGHCAFWARQRTRECVRNPAFMHHNCALTCGICSEEENVLPEEADGEEDNGDAEEGVDAGEAGDAGLDPGEEVGDDGGGKSGHEGARDEL